MRSSVSREALVGLHLHCMDEVWKLGTVVYEERGQVIPDQVLVPTDAVDLRCKAVGVALIVAAADASHHDGKA